MFWLRSIVDPMIDTTTPHGKLVLAVLGALSEFERSMILARTSDGRKRAQERGGRFGHRPKLSPFQIAEALRRKANGEALTEIGKSYGVSHSTISRLWWPSLVEIIEMAVALPDAPLTLNTLARLAALKGVTLGLQRRGIGISHLTDQELNAIARVISTNITPSWSPRQKKTFEPAVDCGKLQNGKRNIEQRP
jgi:resolvase-like protein